MHSVIPKADISEEVEEVNGFLILASVSSSDFSANGVVLNFSNSKSASNDLKGSTFDFAKREKKRKMEDFPTKVVLVGA